MLAGSTVCWHSRLPNLIRSCSECWEVEICARSALLHAATILSITVSLAPGTFNPNGPLHSGVRLETV